MSDGTSILAEHCRQVAESATSAIQWLRGLRFRAPEQRQFLEEELRHISWRADILRRNISRPANVALFGPNQSGKSYLAAALSRRGSAAPRILLGEERLDYLATTSASSPARSSACVTRFSLRRPAAYPTGEGAVGLMVPIRLLTQSDVVRIVANAYLEDIDPEAVEAVTPEALSGLLATLRSQAGTRVRVGLTVQDVLDIRHYFDRYYADHPVMRGIGDEYWNEAMALAPRLNGVQRATLFAPFWGAVPQLGSLSARLLDSLDALGNPTMVFAEKAALTGGSNAITEVETMMQGLEDDAAPRLKVGTVEGFRGDISRPVLAALAQELHLTLDEAPHAFFQEADLLDFPGALPRNRFTDPESLLADPTNRAWLFRRGKAAYLFQRYASEQELTSLVLCLEDGPQTARALPGQVKDWIDVSHGATPEERAKLPCGLFVALTKFDQELKDQLSQKEDDPDHWTQRLRSVFGDYLCREHRWADAWTPAKAFTSTYWVRQVSFIDQDLMQYDSTGRETGVADRARMTRMRQRYLGSPQAVRYFGDASRAWDEGLRANDGGASHLANQLRAVCDPDTRRRQVADGLGGLARDLQHLLEPFQSASYVSQDGVVDVPANSRAAITARAAETVGGDVLDEPPPPSMPDEDVAAGPGSEGDTAWSEPVTEGPPPEPPAPEPPAGEPPSLEPVAAEPPADESPEPAPETMWQPEPEQEPATAEVAAVAAPEPAMAAAPSAPEPSPTRPQPAAPPPIPAMADPQQGGGSGKLIGIGIGAVVLIGGAIAFMTGMFDSKPKPPAEPPRQVAEAPAQPAPPPTPAPTPPAPVAQPAPPPPPQPEVPRCGPVQAPERLSSLPANLTIGPADLVCVANRWISVGRPGDAVLLLTRALQESPNKTFGPASLALARLYDPRRETPNWPANAAYAIEKYEDAIADNGHPDVQALAREDLEALRKTQ